MNKLSQRECDAKVRSTSTASGIGNRIQVFLGELCREETCYDVSLASEQSKIKKLVYTTAVGCPREANALPAALSIYTF